MRRGSDDNCYNNNGNTELVTLHWIVQRIRVGEEKVTRACNRRDVDINRGLENSINVGMG